MEIGDGFFEEVEGLCVFFGEEFVVCIFLEDIDVDVVEVVGGGVGGIGFGWYVVKICGGYGVEWVEVGDDVEDVGSVFD